MGQLEFTKLGFEHIPLLKSYFKRQKRRICDCTVGSTMMWRDYFDNCFAVAEDTIIFRSRYLDGQYVFTVPIGENPEWMLDLAQQYCREHGIDLEFSNVTPLDLDMLRDRWPDSKVESNRDWYDYLYEYQDLVDFAGKKYAAQRNHIRRFERDHPNWSFSRMTAKDTEEVKGFYEKLLSERTKESDTAMAESEKMFEVLERFEEYDFLGGILRADGQIVGVAMGEIVRDTLFVHIEKADINYSGVYPKLVNCFAREFQREDVKFINREEDVGDLGLRKSKLSYRPLKLLEKYTVKVHRTNGGEI